MRNWIWKILHDDIHELMPSPKVFHLAVFFFLRACSKPHEFGRQGCKRRCHTRLYFTLTHTISANWMDPHSGVFNMLLEMQRTKSCNSRVTRVVPHYSPSHPSFFLKPCQSKNRSSSCRSTKLRMIHAWKVLQTPPLPPGSW